jgi:hypothetical protein
MMALVTINASNKAATATNFDDLRKRLASRIIG